MKVFLTGGTGFIGQPLTQAFLKRGWQVTALVRQPHSAEAQTLQKLGATLAQGDVTDRESMRAAMTGAEMVLHNAGAYELGVTRAGAQRMRAINVDGTENALGLAAELRIRKIVYTSTCNIYGDTGGPLVDETHQRTAPVLTEYEQSKIDAHAIAVKYQQQGAPVTIACPAIVIGPGDHASFGWFARMYVRGLLPPAVWAPDSIFTIGYVDDVAEGLALVAERGQAGETYNIGGGQISMRRIVETWKRTPGGLKPFLWLPRPLALFTGLITEPLLRLLGLSAFISREVVTASYVTFRHSSAKAERELGFQYRSPEQAWLDTLAGERAKLKP